MVTLSQPWGYSFQTEPEPKEHNPTDREHLRSARDLVNEAMDELRDMGDLEGIEDEWMRLLDDLERVRGRFQKLERVV